MADHTDFRIEEDAPRFDLGAIVTLAAALWLPVVIFAALFV